MTRHSPFRISAYVLSMTAILLTVAGSQQLANEDYPSSAGRSGRSFAFAVAGPLVVTNVLWFTAIDRVGPVARVAVREPAVLPRRGLRRDPALRDDHAAAGRGGATIGAAILLSRFQRARRARAAAGRMSRRARASPTRRRATSTRSAACSRSTSGLMVTLLLAALDQTIVATALPRIVSDLGGITQYSWVFTAYMLTSTVTVPLYGRLGDVHGRRPLMLISISIFLVGSALCGLAQGMTQLIVFRAIQGIGAGGLFPLSLAVIGGDRAAARPRPLAGTDRRRLRGLVDHRAGRRRVHRRQHDLALDLPRQPARRRGRARRDLR